MYFGVGRPTKKINLNKSNEKSVRRIIFQNKDLGWNNKDLDESGIVEANEGPMENNHKNRDSSNLRLRQLIAFKQRSSKNLDK